MFGETGDPLFDKWEKELAMGIEPDLTEGLPQEEKEKLFKEQEAARAEKQKLSQAASIDENFESAIRAAPEYATKTLGSGSIPGTSPLNILGRK